MAPLEVEPIGRVESPLTDPASAPMQGEEGAPDAWLVFDPAVLEALQGVRPGDEVILEALDGTPIVDVKPVLSREISER
jgi:tRNA (Thr-GGU) A37 N-methylase